MFFLWSHWRPNLKNEILGSILQSLMIILEFTSLETTLTVIYPPGMQKNKNDFLQLSRL